MFNNSLKNKPISEQYNYKDSVVKTCNEVTIIVDIKKRQAATLKTKKVEFMV